MAGDAGAGVGAGVAAACFGVNTSGGTSGVWLGRTGADLGIGAGAAAGGLGVNMSGRSAGGLAGRAGVVARDDGMGANGIGCEGGTAGCAGVGGAAGAGAFFAIGIEVPAGGGLGVGTDEIAPRAGVTGAGTAWRGAAGLTGFAFPTEKTSPSPFASNGLLISAGTSTCFCAGRRTSKAGLSCVSTSFRGSMTAMRSLSAPPANTWGAAWRMSPKGTLTAPCES